MRKSIVISVLFATALGLTALAPEVDADDRRKASNRSASKAPHRIVRHPRVGHRVQTLPKGHVTVRAKRRNYRYYDGSFYRPHRDGAHVVVRAPIGARVRRLPSGYVSFLIGPQHYFYTNFTYYLWDEPRREYVVVEEPDGVEAAVVSASASTSGEIFVYPNEGQSDEQRDRDRYECYVWAVEQTGFDPADGEPEMDKAGDYRRAISACLEGRRYTVK